MITNNPNYFLFTIFTFLFIEPVYAQKIPKNFDVNFKFGFHAKDATLFDSKKKTLVVQGVDTVMTFKLRLTGKERNTIYKELQKINFLGYPEKYKYQFTDSLKTFSNSPCQHYFLTITLKSNLKTVEWDDCIRSINKDERHAALMTLGGIIENIIWSGNPLKDYHPTRMWIDPN